MTRLTLAGALASGALIIVLSGCGGAATPLPAASAVAVLPSQAVQSAAEPSTEPSTAEATPTPAEASIAIPSFTLPSEAKDLEALLPDTLCGAKATKASMSGASFAATADESFKATLAALGKQPSDVAFAFAFTTADCGAGIFRINGVDQGALKQALLAEEQKSGNAYTESTVGGKSVFVSDQGSGKQYAYFAGDAVIFAQAKDDATAAGILQQLPG
jgi:hypothetical protein